jgi:hypothetical protein
MRLLSLILIVFMVSCQTQPVQYVSPAPGQVAPAVVQQQADPYQVYDNGSGGRVVYYTDPYYHTSYWLDYALFMSMWGNPNRYTMLGNYYTGHRSYIISHNSYYSRTYTHRYSSPGYNRSSPAYSRPSSPAYSRPSSPAYSRPSSPAYSRPSSPAYSRPSSPSPYRPSSPSRRH